MSQIILDIPDDTLLSLRLTAQTAAAEIRLAAAMKLYELGQLSSGAAARFADLPKAVFLGKLADYGIATFRHSASDLDQDTRLA